MRFLLIMWTTLILCCPTVWAAPATLQNLYINPENKKLSEAMIFYNSANTCENCSKTINLLISILRKNYQGKLHAYLIDIARHPEFITAFQLKGPLNFVIIRISDGAAFGYRKISGLQSQINNPQNFSRTITEFINNFLGF